MLTALEAKKLARASKQKTFVRLGIKPKIGKHWTGQFTCSYGRFIAFGLTQEQAYYNWLDRQILI